jgi:tetratricopeptide (TPR) repeat protein
MTPTLIPTAPARMLVLMLVAIQPLCQEAGALQESQSARARVLGRVNLALALAASDSGKFDQARRDLDQSLAACPMSAGGRECRLLYASGLGSLLYRQAARDQASRESLYQGAIAYYDRILKEAPENSEAIYGKALSYRALGPHEWMEPFFQQAPKLDRSRSALYYTFLGDYYAAEQRWSNAADAYQRVVQQDADQDGARSGLIDALAAQGPKKNRELVRYAQDWQVRYPGSAADAYRAVLTNSFGPGGERDAVADSAVVGLLRTQARGGLAPGEMPQGVRADWTPVRELNAFQKGSGAEAIPWWRQDEERREALAQAQLALGRAALSNRDYAKAESLWTRGAALPDPSSPITLDLQRELALLYVRHPELDPKGRKFNTLEETLYRGKGGALFIGDLESAQRFHTTLGLIYLERGVWRSPDGVRGAEPQLTWALGKAEQRERREKYYQPLPELRLLLARGLDSAGRREPAAQRYLEAATAFLDTDQLDAADSAARKAMGVRGDAAAPLQLVAQRAAIARGAEAAAEACTGERIARSIRGTGKADFVARQQFKMLADCIKLGSPNLRREHAIAAFRLIDSAAGDSTGATLVGGGDIARFERVMITLLDPFGVSFQTAHLDRGSVKSGPFIRVSLPGETKPLWYTVAEDDMVAARVVSQLGSAVGPFPISVSAGVVTLPATTDVSPAVLKQLKKVPGVRELRSRVY